MYLQVPIDYYDIRLNVGGDFTPGNPATRLDPPDAAEWDDVEVMIGSVDITELLANLYERSGDTALEAVLDRAELEAERMIDSMRDAP